MPKIGSHAVIGIAMMIATVNAAIAISGIFAITMISLANIAIPEIIPIPIVTMRTGLRRTRSRIVISCQIFATKYPIAHIDHSRYIDHESQHSQG